MFDFSKALAEAKDKSGSSYDQFGKKIGIGGETVRHYIRGEATPSLRTADKILSTLGIAAEIGKVDAEVVVENIDDLPAALRQQREAADMGIGELTRITLVAFESIRKIERGKTKSPQLFTVEVLCKTLGIKVLTGRANNER